MGRSKQGKPRRPRRPREYTLKDLQPPGDAYAEWIAVRPDMAPSAVEGDARLSAEAVDFMHRIARLSPVYGRSMPKAALLLDTLIDGGQLPVFGHDDNGELVPVEELAAQMGSGPGDVRESLHSLHAVGALLVFVEDETAYVRIVAQRPAEPGDPWQFMGDPGAAVATTCVPHQMLEELPVDVAGAAMFMRSRRSQLREPDPAEFGKRPDVGGEDQARKLFEAATASGWVDYKGCDACPTGHLCTRESEEGQS